MKAHSFIHVKRKQGALRRASLCDAVRIERETMSAKIEERVEEIVQDLLPVQPELELVDV